MSPFLLFRHSRANQVSLLRKWVNYVRFFLPLWSWRKFGNALLVLASYALSRLTGRYFVWGKPYSFMIEPSAICNLRCPQCPVGLKTLSRPQDNMRFADFKAIIDDIADYTWVIQLYFQGESFINPEILDMVNYAYQHKIYTTISTNGTRLANETFARDLAASKLGTLILSIDGASEETYTIYRQAGHFDRVLKGVRNFMRARGEMGKTFPIADLQFIVMRHNEHEMETIRELGRELGVDKVIYKSPQIYDFENAEDTLPQNPRFRRYEKKDGQYVLKGSFSGYCKKIWYGSVITWDRKVIPCCFDKDAEFPLGEMGKESFGEIWEKEIYHQFRHHVVDNRDQIAMCRNCTEGLRKFWRA